MWPPVFGQRWRGETEPETQGVDGDLGLPARMALEEDGKVVSHGGQGQGGFGFNSSQQEGRICIVPDRDPAGPSTAVGVCRKLVMIVIDHI